MRTVYKYELEEGVNYIFLPCDYKVLSVQNQHNKIVLYCLVETLVKGISKVRFEVVGTGYEVRSNPYNSKFIGTVMLDDGDLVYHVFHKMGNAV